MRFAVGCLVLALVLVGGDAIGIVGSWAFPASAVVLLFAAVLAAVAMEESDSLSIEGLVGASAAVLAPSPPVSAAELPLGEVPLSEVT